MNQLTLEKSHILANIVQPRLQQAAALAHTQEGSILTRGHLIVLNVINHVLQKLN